MNLLGVKVLITGGTSGIGLKMVEALLREKAKVIVVARDQAKLDQLQQNYELSGVYCCDLSDPQAIEQSIEVIMASHPDLQVLINNAGIQNNIRFYDAISTPKVIEDELRINFLAPLLLIRTLLPNLLKQKEAAIVNVTSGLAIVPKTNSAVYCGTKGGLRIFTQALRNQLKDTSVHMIEILPSVVDTKMTAGRGRNKLSPERVAFDTVKALHKGKSEVHVGKTKILFWLNRFSPSLASNVMKRFG
jgi:short-subunit dehydrogenase involved in D-alanine esterification of teichoic acids